MRMMKAIKNALWQRKVTVLACVVVATVMGGSSALAANGGNFILATNNTATLATYMTAAVPGTASLIITNSNTTANSTALDLRVTSGKAPLKVNSDVKVTNLNADKVDGLDSSAFVPAAKAPLWAHVTSSGTLVRGNGVQSSGRFSTGYYFVQFNRDVSFCGYVATTTDGYAGPTGTVQGAAYGYPQEVFVYTTAGGARVDLPFHLIVTC